MFRKQPLNKTRINNMNWLLSIILITLSICSFANPQNNSEKIIVGYYADWSAVPFTSIPVKNLDVINYAFADAKADGSVKLLNETVDKQNFSDITKLKQTNPNLKVLISIGGWTLSKNFSKIANDSALTAKFVSDIQNLMRQYPGLDGVDIDWEYPVSGGDNITHSPNDKQNYVTLLKSIRMGLDSLGVKHYYITIAGPHHSHQGDEGSVDNLDVKAMMQYIDWINVMAYDMHQSTSDPTNTNNDAALYQSPVNPSSFAGDDSIDASIRDYKKQGLSAKEMNQLVMGIPLYGFAWKGVVDPQEKGGNWLLPANPGLYASANDKLENKYVKGSDGFFTYTTIMSHLISDQQLQPSWNDEFKFVTYYSPAQESFLTFDDVQTVKAKSAFIKAQGLRGAMFWELSGDTFDKNSLVYRACGELRGAANCAIPPAPPKMKLWLINNDPNNPVTVTLVTADKSAWYPFPQLASRDQQGGNVVYNETNSGNVKTLMNSDGVLILLTAANGAQVWCGGKLDFTSRDHHDIQVYFSNPTPSCAVDQRQW
jgi:chitinase